MKLKIAFDASLQYDTVSYYDVACKSTILFAAFFFRGHMLKKAPSQKTRESLDERLLTAAVDVFLEKGFAAASVDEIAARAKASKLTFYNHYGNKEALFEAVVRRQNGSLEEALAVKVPGDMKLREFLNAVAHSVFRAFLRSDTIKLIRMLHAEAGRFPQLMNFFDEAGPARATKLIAVQVEKYMVRGDLQKADPILAAEHFFHLSLGELIRRILLGVQPLSKIEMNKRINAGIEAFLRAYAPTEK